MAFAHLHRQMRDFLYNYAEGKLDRALFINGMDGMIGQIDNIVRENGSYSCSYSRVLDEAPVTKASLREVAEKAVLQKVLNDLKNGFVVTASGKLEDLIKHKK